MPAAPQTNDLVHNHRNVHRQSMLFWGFFFFVPPLIMIAFNGGRLSMSREELLATETAKRRVSNRAEAARSPHARVLCNDRIARASAARHPPCDLPPAT